MKHDITAEKVINEALVLKDRVAGSDFPIHILPKQLQDIARATNQCLGYPIDFVASAMLFAVSVAMGNTISVRFKEGWTEKGILYIAIVGKAGTNKSHPLSYAMQPLLDHDAKESRKYSESLEEHNRIYSLSKKEKEEEGIIEHPKRPVLKKFIVSDTTPEGLSEVLHDNKRGICLYVDELKSWINNFNRYSKGSEEQMWLSTFSGKPIIIDRRGSESISIRHTFIGVIGSIQHGVLKDLSKGEKSDNGFLDRILFVVPKDLQKKYWSIEDLPSHITPLWNNVMEKVININLALDDNGDPVPKQLPYESQAKRRLYEWQRHNTDLCNSETNERLVGVYSKLEIYAIRFSLIIQIVRWACKEADNDCIDLVSVESAIELAEYFRKTSQYVQLILSSSAILEQLPSDKLKLYDALPADFSTTESYIIAGRFNISKDSVNRFLKELKNGLLDNYKHVRYKKIL